MTTVEKLTATATAVEQGCRFGRPQRTAERQLCSSSILTRAMAAIGGSLGWVHGEARGGRVLYGKLGGGKDRVTAGRKDYAQFGNQNQNRNGIPENRQNPTRFWTLFGNRTEACSIWEVMDLESCSDLDLEGL